MNGTPETETPSNAQNARPTGTNTQISADEQNIREALVLSCILQQKVVKGRVYPHQFYDDEEDTEGNKGNIIIWSIRSIGSSTRAVVGLSTDSERSLKSCPICLDAYEDGEDVCWSKNDECVHAFHLSCMMEWLMDNDDCPMCRANYLTNSESEIPDLPAV